jgi:hypothetical protein
VSDQRVWFRVLAMTPRVVVLMLRESWTTVPQNR